MRSPSRCERVRTVSGLICWLDEEIVDLTLPARLCPLDGTVMVAETLELICLMR
jgi:hypothetical protein